MQRTATGGPKDDLLQDRAGGRGGGVRVGPGPAGLPHNERFWEKWGGLGANWE